MSEGEIAALSIGTVTYGVVLATVGRAVFADVARVDHEPWPRALRQYVRQRDFAEAGWYLLGPIIAAVAMTTLLWGTAVGLVVWGLDVVGVVDL